MLSVGLTGGIGSGKTTIAAVFDALGIPVYNADAAAKRLMNEDEMLRGQLVLMFGEALYKKNQLDRAYLANIVFGNKEKLAALNNLVHPLTIADATQWFQKQTSPYAIKEAALIFESDSWKDLDAVIGVSAPETIRIQRVMKRDNIDAQQVTARMTQQMDEAQKMSKCDYIITNDDVSLVMPQILKIDQLLRERNLDKPTK